MYFKMNVAPCGNILICILHKFGYHDTAYYFAYGKQYKEILKINVVYMKKVVIFAFHEICFKIRFVLNELLYNNSACRFHHLNYNQD